MRSMDVGPLRCDFDGFCEEFAYPKSKNKERMFTLEDAQESLVGNSYLSS